MRKLIETFAVLVVAGGLSACGSVEYRCPLEHDKKPSDPTACVGMTEALRSAQQGTGSRVSSVLDEKGKKLEIDLSNSQAVVMPPPGPVAQPSMAPMYNPPKVFQVWTGAYVDDQGNLHDGRTSWFATEGSWAYGQTNGVNAAPAAVPKAKARTGQAGVIRPSVPADAERIIAERYAAHVQEVTVAGVPTAPTAQPQAAAPAPTGVAAANQAAARNLATATGANSGVPRTTPAAGVTPPAVKLAN